MKSTTKNKAVRCESAPGLVPGLLIMGLAGFGTAAAEQTVFADPETAANRLVIAVARSDSTALEGLLGDNYRQVLPVEQIEAGDVERFLDAWSTYHTLVPVDETTRMLAAGTSGWTLPMPIVHTADGWRFDTAAGANLMKVRRIGRNELAAMQALLAYHDAQMEYAMADHDGDGVLEFAQQFKSTVGRQDGLYWEAGPDEPQSPLGPLFEAEEVKSDYHGYRYRILTAQGEHAPGGALDYLVNGNMVGGFAIVAWPAEYGDSGVTSFILSRSGVMYEADLGPASAAEGQAMTAFDPGPVWSLVPPDFTASLD